MAYEKDVLPIIGRPYAGSGQVGITGLSSLKYADVTHQGFNRIANANPPF